MMKFNIYKIVWYILQVTEKPYRIKQGNTYQLFAFEIDYSANHVENKAIFKKQYK